MTLWKRLFSKLELRSRVRKRASDAGIHLLFSGIMLATAIILLIYVVVFVDKPNKKYMNGKKTECNIIAAEKACWRRKLLSSARIEEGRNICWHFIVRYEDIFTKVQYMGVDDFPDEHDGCKSATSCGLEVWPCRASKEDPKDVVLRWAYPLKGVIYSSLGIVCTLLCGGLAGWQFYRDRQLDDEDDEKDIVSDEPVPFSFRSRLPTWMRTESVATTIPPPTAVAWQL